MEPGPPGGPGVRMADSSGSSFPWASVAMLAAFVTSAFVVPEAFERMRPPERERAQPAAEVELEVDARLWEDPFMALRRFESEQAERCKDPSRKDECEEQRKRARTNREPGVVRQLLTKVVQDNTDATEAPARAAARGAGASMVAAAAKGEDPPPAVRQLVIAALVPGNPFVGAEEARRRTRYAVLSALMAKGYVPDNAERMGVVDFRAVGRRPAADADGAGDAQLQSVALANAAAASAAAAPPRPWIAPYEVLVRRPRFAPPREPRDAREAPRAWEASRPPYTAVAVVWINESALPKPKLNHLAIALDGLVNGGGLGNEAAPDIAVIGPSSSDAVREALADLDDFRDGWRESDQRALPAGFELFARARLLSPSSTAPECLLLRLSDDPQRREECGKAEGQIREHITRQLWEPLRLKGPVDFQRTIATDRELLGALLAELKRRLPANEKRRVVLVAERDSLYAQALVFEFRRLVRESAGAVVASAQGPSPIGTAHAASPVAGAKCADETGWVTAGNIELQVAYFFRGIDGVTLRDAADKPAADKKGRPEASIEWPESRDQLDYLRRMATSLKDSEGGYHHDKNNDCRKTHNTPIGAIGILANDVHDKLLVLQALRKSFQDKVFFTTDMDSRFLHPGAVDFTRNLIVATSLPTEFIDSRAQGSVPAFRDVYQTATFIATRRALCGKQQRCDEAAEKVYARALAAPSVYEIGRLHAVPLDGYAFDTRVDGSTQGRIALATGLAMLMIVALLGWPSTPSMRRLRAALAAAARPRAPAAVDEEPRLSHGAAITAALHLTLLVYALASLAEFAAGSGRGLGAALTTALVTGGALAGLTLWRSPPALADQPRAARATTIGVASVAALLLGAAVWSLWPLDGAPDAPCADCEPALWLEGVSAWPSHLIHLAALAVALAALDALWSQARAGLRADSAWLGIDCPRRSPPRAAGLLGLVERLGEYSMLSWRRPQDPSTAFSTLWCEYVLRGHGAARGLRVLFWWLLTVGLAWALFYGLSGGYVVEFPVRGEAHRQLITWTVYALLLLLPLLIVAVADSTMLACRFVRFLNAGRTSYPDATVARFARELGAQNVAPWTQRIALDPDRRAGDAPAAHTLLDDWIDVQVVERRTRWVSSLVVGPFVVISLMVVARSRLFDTWAFTAPIAVAVSGYCLWLIILAALLKKSADDTRARALARMRVDLRWLAGSGGDQARLVEPFKQLIAAVEANRGGAFASFFEQPLFKALMIPLGSAGGAQIIDQVLQMR